MVVWAQGGWRPGLGLQRREGLPDAAPSQLEGSLGWTRRCVLEDPAGAAGPSGGASASVAGATAGHTAAGGGGPPQARGGAAARRGRAAAPRGGAQAARRRGEKEAAARGGRPGQEGGRDEEAARGGGSQAQGTCGCPCRPQGDPARPRGHTRDIRQLARGAGRCAGHSPGGARFPGTEGHAGGAGDTPAGAGAHRQHQRKTRGG
mmetsp:Transcript_27688/g.76203  ORF Transcript_27688/g.76203 Transcript_27688/m.76203 type:complete len:205 (-) Transcript_27688:1789-2403(-)